MAVTLTTAARDAACNAVVDLVDVGAGTNGTMEIATGADVEVATVTFAATAFGASSGGTATAAAITDDTNATGNASPVDKHIVKDQDGNEVWRGNVQTSGGDLNLSSLTIGAGDTVSISSYTVTMPAS